MLMYNSTEFSDDYSKTSRRLRNYYGDEPFLNAYGAIADFAINNNNNSVLFKFETKIAGEEEMMVQKILKLEYH